MPGANPPLAEPLLSAMVALAIGLLVGIDRERKKGEGPDRAAAGVRTFAIAALLGAVCALTSLPLLIAVAAIGLMSLTAIAYARSKQTDPGLTTEVALLATFALGVLTATHRQLAAVLGVLLALVLVSRSSLHAFARKQLSDRELQDAVMLAAAAVVVLPLLPDHAIDPWGAINLQFIWRLTVIVMAINGLGYVALRMIGVRWGLPLAGLLGGFVSSSAVIAAMGQRARAEPSLRQPAVAAAASSSVATVALLAAVVATANPSALATLWLALAAMAAVAVAAGVVYGLHASRVTPSPPPSLGRAFQPRAALLFALLLTVMLFTIALLQRVFGASGALAAAAIGGFLDTHSSAASVAGLGGQGLLEERAVSIGVGLAISANTVTKLVVAAVAGGRAYFFRLAPSLLAMLVAFWCGWALQGQ
jgi:uncharacterized membrane protein (DUF4010 family)